MTKKKKQKELLGWKLENSYATLPESFYTRLKPEPVPSPQMVMLNKTLAADIGLNPEELESQEGIQVLAGNQIPEGATPVAQAYAGHQFGHFTRLGDGRAVLLGEQITPEGKRVDLQLKGSGQTPYSRKGDGRAALGPMLREYIISEAMHGLGIPTTRSLAVVSTGDPVFREHRLAGGILCRVAASHIRVGTFEYVAKWDTKEHLRQLAEYTYHRHYAGLESVENPYLSLLKQVVNSQAALIAKWQLTGFVHGVMNTDNMAISGETIDYGPCAFMDTYHSSTVFSSIDYYGRYAYGNQPTMAGWNLARFAETLLPLLDPDEKKALEVAQEVLAQYPVLFRQYWLDGFRNKLGIETGSPQDIKLVEDLLQLMEKNQMDFTNTFRNLTLNIAKEEANIGITPGEKKEEFNQWLQRWRRRIAHQRIPLPQIATKMKESNPSVIPRNYWVEKALEAVVTQQDFTLMESLLEALKNPYAYTDDQEKYAQSPPPFDKPYKTYCGT